MRKAGAGLQTRASNYTTSYANIRALCFKVSGQNRTFILKPHTSIIWID